MKRIAMLAALLAVLAPGGRAGAQSAASSPVPDASPVPVPTLGPAERPARGPGKAQMQGRGQGRMRGGGTMAMLLQTADRVTVENTADGATVKFSAQDPEAVQRIQKLAESMRLTHEARPK